VRVTELSKIVEHAVGEGEETQIVPFCTWWARGLSCVRELEGLGGIFQSNLVQELNTVACQSYDQCPGRPKQRGACVPPWYLPSLGMPSGNPTG
jgi:hypothetical protein